MPVAGEEEKLGFLREVGTHRIRHRHCSLLAHTLATRDLLAAWEAGSALCDAGLFHAVYGTEELDPSLERPPVAASERGRVRSLIGEEAERWVWCFRHLDRKGFVAWAAAGASGPAPQRSGEPLGPLASADVTALANLTVANALEQLARRRHRHRRRTLALHVLRPHLLPGAAAALARERSWRGRLRYRLAPGP